MNILLALTRFSLVEQDNNRTYILLPLGLLKNDKLLYKDAQKSVVIIQ